MDYEHYDSWTLTKPMIDNILSYPQFSSVTEELLYYNRYHYTYNINVASGQLFYGLVFSNGSFRGVILGCC